MVRSRRKSVDLQLGQCVGREVAQQLVLQKLVLERKRRGRKVTYHPGTTDDASLRVRDDHNALLGRVHHSAPDDLGTLERIKRTTHLVAASNVLRGPEEVALEDTFD